MGRLFGGKIGFVQGANLDFQSLSGVFSIFDQYYSKRRGGWKNALATGGDNLLLYLDSNGNIWTVLEFTQPGTLVCNEPGLCDVFMIGGGGAGGRSYGNNDTGKGGGGAGMALWRQSFPITAGSYPITVGLGGVSPGTTESNQSSYGQGNFGGDTIAFGVTAKGGVGGHASDNYGSFSTTGGCGGGGGARNNNPRDNGSTGGGFPVANWTNYTNAGGNSGSGNYSGAGGGGIGGAGSNQSGGTNDPNSQGGAGGVGLDFSPFFGSSVGDSGWFGGGGGGGTYRYGGPIAYRAAGGQGGGGKGTTAQEDSLGGASVASDVNGMANTGGGGGGSSEGDGNPGSISGSGGSGVVIVRFR